MSRPTVLLAVLCAVVFSAGCGKEGSESSSAPTPKSTPAQVPAESLADVSANLTKAGFEVENDTEPTEGVVEGINVESEPDGTAGTSIWVYASPADADAQAQTFDSAGAKDEGDLYRVVKDRFYFAISRGDDLSPETQRAFDQFVDTAEGLGGTSKPSSVKPLGVPPRSTKASQTSQVRLAALLQEEDAFCREWCTVVVQLAAGEADDENELAEAVSPVIGMAFHSSNWRPGKIVNLDLESKDRKTTVWGLHCPATARDAVDWNNATADEVLAACRAKFG